MKTKAYTNGLTILLINVIIILTSFAAQAQLPSCDKVYLHGTNNELYTYDPATNTTTLNSISMPAGAHGLAVNQNFFSASPSPTFYTTKNSKYYYYNGSSWVNTGHSTGSSAAVNIGGAGPFIYNVNGSTNTIYKYDGTGNGTFYMNLSTNGPWDCMGDENGNFYVINGNKLKKFGPNGNLLCSYDIVGYNNTGIGGGYAIVNGVVYADNGYVQYKGIINGSTINFTPISFNGVGSLSDFANCPFPPLNLTIDPPPALSCSTSSIQLSVTTTINNPVYNWTGPGIVSGGNTATPTVNQTGDYTVTVTGQGSSGQCGTSGTQQITVVGSSGVTPTFTNPGPFCEGSNFTLPTTSDNGIDGTWSPAVNNTTTTTYTFTPTSGSCNTTTTMEVVINSKPNIDAGTDQSICDGTSVTLSGSGAGTYTWDHSVTDGTAFTPSVGTTTYTVTGTDGNGCTNTDQVDVTVNPKPTIDAGNNQSVCDGTSVTLSGSGAGTGTYTWDNSVTDGTAFTPSVGTTTYTVTGTDGNGCTNTDQVEVTVNPNPTYTSTLTDATCGNADGEIDLTASTGATPYTYSIDNGSTTQSTGTFSGLTANTYAIVITDNNGCEVTGSETISQQAGPTIDNVTPTNPSCNGVCDGQIQATISGGSSPFTYTWTDANNAPVGSNANSINGLCDGTYNLKVTDGNNCEVTQNNITLTEPSQIVATFDMTDHCAGMNSPATNMATSGGTFSFNPAPGDGATVSATTGAISNGVGGTTYTVEYTVTMNGCSAYSTQDVTVYELPTYTPTLTDATCGNDNGEIDLTTNTGATPFVYSIDNGTTTQSTGTFSGLADGNYVVLITDNNGCKVTGSESIAQLGSPSITSINSTNPSCYQVCDGTAIVAASGGSTPYTFNWTDANAASVGNSDQASGLCDGQYVVTVTDSSGCVTSGTATLVEPAQIDPSFALTDYCAGDANSASTIATPGGTFTFSPAPGDGATIDATTGAITDGVGGTTYTVQYEAQVGGCSATSTQDITVNSVPVPDFQGDNLEGCAPHGVNFMDATNFSGTSVSCVWDLGDGTTVDDCSGNVAHTYSTAGTYSVTLTTTSDKGCVGTYTATNYITVVPQPVADFTANPMIATTTNPKVDFTNNSTNATTYSWSFGDESPAKTDENVEHKYNTDGAKDYVVTLVASSLDSTCSDTTHLIVRTKEEVIFYVPNTFTPDQDKYNEMFKPVFASGYDPYSYTLLIYNRWGEVLFESHDVNVGWDGTYGGKIVPDGSYVWKITFKEAHTMSDKHHTKVGEVNVLR